MLKGVVLAAGAGTRLRPLTLTTPKALVPVGGRPLVDWALERLVPYVAEVAVNLHHHADQLVEHLTRHPVSRPLHLSIEAPVALGTAGALGRLRPWLAGAAVLVTNADAWYPPAARPVLDELVAGWDGERARLLCVRAPAGGDFGDLRYVGTALLPWSQVARLPEEPAGLYEASWAALYADRSQPGHPLLDLVEADIEAIDCGTPADLARADQRARVADARR